MPADSPATAVISGHGVSIRLEKRENIPTGISLRLLCNYKTRIQFPESVFLSPGGIRIELIEHPAPIILPPAKPEFILTRGDDESTWTDGRAGMQYRDLIPGKLGGRFIASHIRIPNGGETADYAHYHRVLFQMIYCRSGWARLVYEDQGAPFVMNAGDCILQPPEIRHRVLETSAGLEVIEIGCPALHETFSDHDIQLPTGDYNPERLFDGQRFLYHSASGAEWDTGRIDGFEVRDTGMLRATQGLARVRVIGSSQGSGARFSGKHAGEFLFLYILSGKCEIRGSGLGEHSLEECDCCAIPAEAEYEIKASAQFEMLEVSIENMPPAHGRPSG